MQRETTEKLEPDVAEAKLNGHQLLHAPFFYVARDTAFITLLYVALWQYDQWMTPLILLHKDWIYPYCMSLILAMAAGYCVVAQWGRQRRRVRARRVAFSLPLTGLLIAIPITVAKNEVLGSLAFFANCFLAVIGVTISFFVAPQRGPDAEKLLSGVALWEADVFASRLKQSDQSAKEDR